LPFQIVEVFVKIPVEYAIAKIPGEYGGDAGKILVLVILLLFFVGGTLLLVRCVIDFMHSRRASKEEKDTNKRKAA
jgi:hypothetical protein